MKDNIRVGSSRPRSNPEPTASSAKAKAKDKPKSRPAPQPISSIDDEAEAVERRIRRLTVFVAEAPAIAERRLTEMRDYVPPIDPPKTKKKAKPRRLPLEQRQMARRRTLRLAFEFLLLLLVIAAIFGWLNQHYRWFGF